MKKTKPIFIVAGTFLIGFAVGFLVSSQLRMRKMRIASSLMSEESFRGRSYSIIDPTPEQRKRLDPIMLKFAEKNRELILDFRQEATRLMDEHWKEIRPLLNEEQLHRIEEHEKWSRAYWRSRRGTGSEWNRSYNRQGQGRNREDRPGRGREDRPGRGPGWDERPNKYRKPPME